MKIVNYPHPALRHKAKPLTYIDKEIQLRVGEMLELMYSAKGVGLAANQVVLPFQLFVMNPSADPNQREQELVCINPILSDRKGSVEAEEGCLSFPGLYQKVRRAKSVKVQAYNLQGQPFELIASDFPARILQHEADHLEGVLFYDKMGPLAKLSSRGDLQAFEREYRKAQDKGQLPPDADILAAWEAGVLPELKNNGESQGTTGE